MRIPTNAPIDVQQSFKELWDMLDPILTKNFDLSGRRFQGAGDAVLPDEYITKAQLDKTVETLTGKIPASTPVQTGTGGSMDVTGFHQHSVLFVNPDDTLAEDNSHFHYIKESGGKLYLSLGTASPEDLAIFQINSTVQGVMLPRMTTTQRDAMVSPPESLLIYNLTTHTHQHYNGTDWIDIPSSTSAAGGWVDDGTIVRLATATDRVSIGDATGHASASLAVISTSRGFLPPKMNSVQRAAIASPTDGLFVWDTNFLAYYYHKTGQWWKIESGQDSSGWTYEPDPFVPDVILTDGASRVAVGTTTGSSNPRMTIANPASGSNYALKLVGAVTGIEFGPTTSGAATSTIAEGSGVLVFNALLNVLSSGVKIGTGSPVATALLELESTTKGFLPPRLNQAQITAISNPANGLVVHNTTVSKLQYYNGSAWVVLDSIQGASGWTYLPDPFVPEIVLTDGSSRVGLGGTIASNSARVSISDLPGSPYALALQGRVAGSSASMEFRSSSNLFWGTLSAGPSTIGIMNDHLTIAGGIFISQFNDNVGIGVVPTAVKLEVGGSILANGILFATQQASQPNQAVLASRQIIAGNGLQGTASLVSDPTLSINPAASISWSGIQSFQLIRMGGTASVEFYSGATRIGLISADANVLGLSNSTASGYIWIRASDGAILFTGKQIRYGAAGSGAVSGTRAMCIDN